MAALRRPPITAWALNQLARRAQDEVADLAEAGVELVASQSAALGGGGDPRAFEDAQRHQREAVTRLTRTARGLLEEAGHRASDQTVERVAASLRAASVDEEGRRLLERGRFEDDFEGAGLLALAGLAPAATPAPAGRAARRAPEPDRDDAAERKRRREELKAARLRVRAAEQEEGAARRAADRAAKAAATARQAADEAEAEAEKAQRSLARAHEDLDRAKAEAESLESESPDPK